MSSALFVIATLPGHGALSTRASTDPAFTRNYLRGSMRRGAQQQIPFAEACANACNPYLRLSRKAAPDIDRPSRTPSTRRLHGIGKNTTET